MQAANGSVMERPFAADTYPLLAAAMGAIGLMGFLSNLLVLALHCRFERLRTPAALLLANISLSDLLVSACGGNLTFAACVRGRWTWGQAACVWDGFSNSLFGEPSTCPPLRVTSPPPLNCSSVNLPHFKTQNAPPTGVTTMPPGHDQYHALLGGGGLTPSGPTGVRVITSSSGLTPPS